LLKKIISTAILATLPIIAIHADSNITKDSFTNDPMLKDFQKLQSDMNRVFENFNKEFFNDIKIPQIPNNINSGFSFSVKTDVRDKGDHYEIKANLPGIEQKEINTKIKDNILVIEAKTKKSKDDKKNNKIIRQERFEGSFYRAMSLPSDADSNKMTTDYKNGVLTINIPKKK